VASKLAVNFASEPTVFVAIESLNTPSATAGAATIDVFLVGEAATPGKMSIEPGTTLLQMFGEMGGFSKFAAKKRVQLRRTDRKSGKETVYQFSYPDIIAGTSAGGSTRLRDGDVIVIPQRRLFE
jgi:polysaccharide export outer membrane protein